MYYTIRPTPFGPFAIAGTDAGISRADFQEGVRPVLIGSDWIRKDAVFDDAIAALERYCSGQSEPFALRYDVRGTPFQRRVWQALQSIAPGTTRSYRELAQQLGMPTGSRAVGAAVGRNPVNLLVPCHRVVGSNGSLTGYAGGLPLKQRLLRFEGAIVERVS